MVDREPPKSFRFEAAYQGTPPWEIGRPQAPFLAVADEIRGRVLDAGCGTGELAMMAAARGLVATGIDGASSAIGVARQRSADRGLDVEFIVGDVLRLVEVSAPPYDTVLDSGLLHVFDSGDRARYVEQLGAVTAAGGTFMALCLSDLEPGDWGPYRLSRDDLLAAFADGWQAASIEPATFVMADLPHVVPQAHAWFVRFARL